MLVFPGFRLSPPQSGQPGSSPVPGVRRRFGSPRLLPRRVQPLSVPPVCRAQCRRPAMHRTAVDRRKTFPAQPLQRATRLPAPCAFAGRARSVTEGAPVPLLIGLYSRQPHYLFVSFCMTAREIFPYPEAVQVDIIFLSTLNGIVLSASNVTSVLTAAVLVLASMMLRSCSS